MIGPYVAVLIAMLLVPGLPDADKNPWQEKVPEAVRASEARPTVKTLLNALDIAWRADAWREGLAVAERALEKFPESDQLRGHIVRALWRAGRMSQAEKLAEQIPLTTQDAVSLRMLVQIHLARGERASARKAADGLAELPRRDAEDLYTIIGAKVALNDLKDLGRQLLEAEKITDPEAGYPQTYIAESIDGVAEFVEAVGESPLNRIVDFGAARMEALTLLNLPAVAVMINGHGPYRMVLDTGGSIMVSLDRAVADEIGIESISTSLVRGVSGTQESGQALLENVQIGDIQLRRVMARVFDVRAALMNAADGIVGTGVFVEGRMQMDFKDGRLRVSESSAQAAPGESIDLRLVGDAKMLAEVDLEEGRAVALFDTGADAVAIAPSRLKALFPDEKLRSVKMGGAIGVGTDALPEISLGKGADLGLAGRKYDDFIGIGLDVLDTTLGPVIGVQCDVLIGMPVFRDMSTLTVDFPRNRMWVDWLE